MNMNRRIVRPPFNFFDEDEFKEPNFEEENNRQVTISETVIRPDVVCKEVEDDVRNVVAAEEVTKDVLVVLPRQVDEVKPAVQTRKDDAFILVEASKLSLRDDFMRYKPRTRKEKEFKKLLINVIKKGLKDFYRAKYDPSFNEDGTGVVFESGKRPATVKSYNWWEKAAREFMPERQSRIGTKSEYVAFLGVLIKQLVANGWSVREAWNAVCNDSKELGHYRNSKGTKYEIENTGSREICGFCDLANTDKIWAEDIENGVFWLVGVSYHAYGDDYPSHLSL